MVPVDDCIEFRKTEASRLRIARLRERSDRADLHKAKPHAQDAFCTLGILVKPSCYTCNRAEAKMKRFPVLIREYLPTDLQQYYYQQQHIEHSVRELVIIIQDS